ncbi:PLDc N-terminal domain-containing protein [Psychroflexus sp. CAK8W]|uniref:PLDc N-terminal domain-containing protein n=1 Tax=Psychroflexus longus TaxID=2873596 RepID=A0ABS7XIW7_9FLAO|nr:PLDc N-terminal domain-containing protein [Psychroflexus longus]
MDNSSIFILLLILAVGFIWLLPIISILFSSKTSGSEKFAWILAVIFISWFAWIFYLLLAPLKNRSH